MDEVLKIINDIKAGNIKPIYFLMGEEPYYIDKLCEYIEKNILQDHERDFNQTTLYGRDVTIDDIVATAKRFPMMADKQVVIVKEAQDLSRTIDNLETYALNPQPTTVLVICYKYKVLNRTKKATKAIIKAGVLFESKKMFENQLGTWITRVLQSKKLSIEPKASAMLIEFLGNDLSKIANEISKLEIILPPNSIITPLHIEQNIGFSKDFNNFEFIAAIGSMIFDGWLKKFNRTLFLFDALGLGLFTIVGIEIAMEQKFSMGVCIALGTITGSFGGVLRDVLLNNVPLVFQKEIYALASIIGGLCYFLLRHIEMNEDIAKIICILLIFIIRLVAVKYKLSLPVFYTKQKTML